jgi:ABC-type branched-subunit amino acid transport system substrate-binding protein
MKKWLSLAAIAVFCLSQVVGIACSGGQEEQEAVTEIKIGIGVPLSGLAGAVMGIPCQSGMELMAERISVFEVGGKQYRWKVITEDNEGGTAAGGVASTSKFIFDYDVDFVFQAGGGASLGAQRLCEESGILIDMGTCRSDAFGPDHPYSIQTAPCLITHVACFYDWLAREHPEVKRIVVASYDDPVAIAYAEAYESNMHEYFGFESEIVWIPQGTTEYYPVATSVMMLDPDLVIASPGVLNAVWDMGYKRLTAQYGPIMNQGQLEQAGWDDCKGMIFFFPEWYGTEQVWPEAVDLAMEYEARYHSEMGTVAFTGSIVLETLTSALQEAGTVDDMDKVMDTIESRTTFDSMVGPVYYGGEAFVGTNCMLMWPVAIWEVVGEREYKLLGYYGPEEAEATAAEAWTATMR